MSAASGHTPEGFSRIITASLIAHVIVIILGLVIYKGEAKRVYLTPVTVSLVGPEALGRQGAPAAERSAPPAPAAQPAQKQTAGQPVKAAAIPAAKAIKKAAARPITKTVLPRAKGSSPAKMKNAFASKKTKDNAAADDAIKRLKEKVRKKEDKEELSSAESHISALKKKNSPAAAPAKAVKRAGHEGVLRSSGALQAFSKADGAPKDGVTTGGGKGADSPSVKYRAYLTAIGDRVKQNWSYPEELRKDKIEIIVSIKIGKNGKLLDSWVEKSSGSGLFDESLMDAVKKSAPYPELPEDYDGNVFETGLRFCKNCGQ